jgi:hypothetical protein
VRTRDGRLHIIAPFHTISGAEPIEHPDFQHDRGIDRAPKVLTRAPSGDFAVATSAKMWRVIYTPWAGGYARDRTVWGIEKSLPGSTIRVPEPVRQKQAPPPANSYKVAFLIAARDRDEITGAMIRRIDDIRRYWDALFDAVTEHQRQSNSGPYSGPDSGTLRINPARLSFGSVVVNRSRTLTVSIKNTGRVDVNIHVQGRSTAPFRWAALSAVIAPEQERVISVEFTPTGRGLAEITMLIQSDVPGSPHPVELTGTGRLAQNPPVRPVPLDPP